MNYRGFIIKKEKLAGLEIALFGIIPLNKYSEKFGYQIYMPNGNKVLSAPFLNIQDCKDHIDWAIEFKVKLDKPINLKYLGVGKFFPRYAVEI